MKREKIENNILIYRETLRSVLGHATKFSVHILPEKKISRKFFLNFFVKILKDTKKLSHDLGYLAKLSQKCHFLFREKPMGHGSKLIQFFCNVAQAGSYIALNALNQKKNFEILYTVHILGEIFYSE